MSEDLRLMPILGVMVALASAFPAALADDVAAVAALMPSDRLAATASSWSVELAGETVAVLGRVYSPEPDEVAVRELSVQQHTILQCLYTRHHGGFVRQRYVEQVVGSTEPWVVPFITEIAGEYIPQILIAIRRGLPDLEQPGSAHNLLYGQFIRNNPAYFDRLQRRIVSYWTCFWQRDDYANFERYPGCGLIESLRAAASPDWPRLTPPGPARSS
jgi:hypothetical protein